MYLKNFTVERVLFLNLAHIPHDDLETEQNSFVVVRQNLTCTDKTSKVSERFLAE